MTPNRAEGVIDLAIPRAESRGPDVAGLFRTAAAAEQRRDFEEAEALTLRAVAALERQPGPLQPDLAFGLHNLGMLASRRGDLAQAVALLRRAREVGEQTVGDRDARYATVLHNLATVLQQAGDLVEAEPLVQQALTIRRARLGEDHPECALSLASLGALYLRRGETNWARLMYREALGVRRKALGEVHPLTVQTLLDLVAIARQQLDWAKADALMAEVLAAQEVAHGSGHPEVANSHSRRATLRLKLKDLDGAERHLRKALEIRKRALGEDHPDYANCLRDLDFLLDHRGELRRGAAPLRRSAPVPPADSAAELPGTPAPTPAPSPAPVPTADEAFRAGLAASERPPSPAPALGPRIETNPPAPAERHTAAVREGHGGGKGPRPRSRMMEPVSHDLSRELADLGEALAGLGERFLVAASLFHHPGSFPDPGLLEEVARRREELADLRDRAVRKAEEVGVKLPPRDTLDSVQGLNLLVDAMTTEQANRERLGASRRRAREVVEGVQQLVYLGPAPLPALADCQAAARSLAETLAAEDGGSELSEDARLLAEGGHPLERFLHLVVHREELGVDEWAELYEQVVAAYGRTLAAAVALSRVTLAPRDAADPGGASTAAVATGRDDPEARSRRLTGSSPSHVTVH